MWKLIPLPYKLIGAGVIMALLLGGIWYAIHSYGKRRYQEGRNSMELERLDKEEKALQQKYADLNKANLEKAKALDARETALARISAQLSREHVELEASSHARQEEIDKEQSAREAEIRNLPNASVVAAFRTELERVRAAEARAAKRTPDH